MQQLLSINAFAVYSSTVYMSIQWFCDGLVLKVRQEITKSHFEQLLVVLGYYGTETGFSLFCQMYARVTTCVADYFRWFHELFEKLARCREL